MNLVQVQVTKIRKMLLRAAKQVNKDIVEVTVSLYGDRHSNVSMSVNVWVKDESEHLGMDLAFGIYVSQKSPKQLRQELVQKVREHFSS